MRDREDREARGDSKWETAVREWGTEETENRGQRRQRTQKIGDRGDRK